MSTIIVDASVAIKWVVEEEGSDAAAALASQDLTAPSLLMVECANALWVKVRRGELTPSEALDRIQVLLAAPVEISPDADLAEHAARLALQLNHPVYDCIYLALALQLDGKLVTADRPFAEAVRRHQDVSGYVVLLGETWDD
jgi:predicted nucleic acid-binding protein